MRRVFVVKLTKVTLFLRTFFGRKNFLKQGIL